MISAIAQCFYLSIHKWKLGEALALESLRPEIADRVLPLFEVPPSSGWDYDQLKVFTAAEHIRFFGTRLGMFWPGRPVLVDASAIDVQRFHDELACHPLRALLERARQSHSLAYPVVSLRNTSDYVNAARDFLARNDHLGFCIRISLSDFDRAGWATALEGLVRALGQRPEKGVLLLDAGPLTFWDDEFVSLLVDAINHLPHLTAWSSLFVASTSFPEKRNAAVGSTGRYTRRDSQLYRALVTRAPELLRMPRFSDYGPSYPAPFRKGGGIPKAHLRYTTINAYLVAEGQSTKGVGLKAIHPVARNLVAQKEYSNPNFSAGAAYFSDLASEAGGPGNPAKWRWGATDHHTTLAVWEQASVHGFPINGPEGATTEEQMDLPELADPKSKK